MRWARSKSRWLLSACLISLLLLTPTDCEGLQLVGAIRSSLLWPPPSPSSLAIPRQDVAVEHLWLILQGVRNKSHCALLLNTTSNSYETSNKKSSSQKISSEQVIATILSPAEVASTFLGCLNKHNFHVSQHGQNPQQEAETRSLFPNVNSINPPSVMKRRFLFERASTAVASPLAPSHYSLSPPAKRLVHWSQV